MSKIGKMRMVQPNKKYGQHFLKDKSVVERIVSLIKLNHSSQKLIEIGPGTGALTSALIPDFIDTLSCIEVDERCVEFLEENYPELQGKIFFEDFLKTNLSSLLIPSATIVGNFPYNISSQIIFKVIDYREQIPLMVGMFQKEVAERITAGHGNKDYGILSVLTQLYYDAEIAFHIAPGAFNPPPKVNSSVLVLKRKEVFPEVNHAIISRLVKAGFNQRRKMLRNPYKGILPSEILQEPFFQQRAEQLSVQDYIELSQRVENL
ncbi:MAG: 16S rRNA (adenine(1518)-N(6)/adenine(1519)-N(6))-dimethyltransferase RsmA [Chitinophagales bacterium]|nr:16S rRNA (adenine(1518)-N(6)/adenine(1519)-N(6))-dimethyltransferase RsmA [Chitinophagales bacterium]